jgi:sugar-specific transcriptional regulator TrmB
LEGVDFVKKNDCIVELIENIKGEIYCDLRQRFECDEVKEIYAKIDNAVERCVSEGHK